MVLARCSCDVHSPAACEGDLSPTGPAVSCAEFFVCAEFFAELSEQGGAAHQCGHLLVCAGQHKSRVAVVSYLRLCRMSKLKAMWEWLPSCLKR